MTIRQPSTANLMLDSADRTNGTAANFSIQRPQALLNGFFTRIATTEVVLEWNSPNISSQTANTITIDLSGSTSGTSSTTVTVPTGFYTQAELIDYLVIQLNDLSGGISPPAHWSVNSTTNGYFALIPSANIYVQFSGPLAAKLGWDAGDFLEYGPTGADGNGLLLTDADLRPYRYLDFVSAQLTYNQDLKDASTAALVRDVLCRWYMAYDEAPQLDKYGFPILMGYTSFTVRRIFNPPKQIRWDNIQPLGNLSFEVFSDAGTRAALSFNTQWLMTLQVSEV